MKRIFLALLVGIFCFSFSAMAQQEPVKDTTLPYKKYPTLPAFSILMMDSVKQFNTYNIPEGKPTMLVMFSPECDHCQRFVKDMMANMDSLNNVQIYMITFLTLPSLRAFYAKNEWKKYKNITAGKDHKYFFMDFYKPKSVPFIIVYDKHKKLVTSFEGNVKITELIAATRQVMDK